MHFYLRLEASYQISKRYENFEQQHFFVKNRNCIFWEVFKEFYDYLKLSKVEGGVWKFEISS